LKIERSTNTMNDFYPSENRRGRRKKKTDWLDILIVLMGLSILVYLIVCAIANVYWLDMAVGL